MSTWLLPRSELTPEQLRAIELPHTEHQVIVGAPGSGKTQILLHRADELRRRLGSAAERFRIFVYTNVLKTYIRSALELLGLAEHTVTTYDNWCITFYRRYVGKALPVNDQENRLDFDEIRQAVARFIANNSVPLPLYDFVLVDEGQDLDTTCFQTLRRIARHVTVCLDHKQQIYERGSSEADILAALGLRRRNLTLLDAYRCSPYVARLAAQLLDDPTERQQYLRQVRTEQTERETPLLYEAINFLDEQHRLVEVLRQRLLIDQRIGVLLPSKVFIESFCLLLKSAGIEVETQKNLNFASGCPKLITFHSAKGLTFDSVLMPRLIPNSFRHTSDEGQHRNLLFVAITRATRWVYLSTVADNKLPVLDSLKSLASEQVLTIQQGGQVPPQPAPFASPTSRDLDFL